MSNTLRVEYLRDGVTPPYGAVAPHLQFVHALRLCYRTAYLREKYPQREHEAVLHLTVRQLMAWPVAHRRMLLRVLLGLHASGINSTHSVSRGIGLWGLSSELLGRGKVAPPTAFDALGTAWPGLGTPARGAGAALLVGDRPGAGWSGRLNWPFISGHRGGCSAWLCDQLEAGAVPESRLRWVNAYAQHGEPTSYVFVQQLKPKIIVALGRNAAKWCEGGNSTCDYEEVHHPQHWKRFHAGHAYHLVKVLQRGLSITPPPRRRS